MGYLPEKRTTSQFELKGRFARQYLSFAGKSSKDFLLYLSGPGVYDAPAADVESNVKAKDQSCKAFWLNNSGLFVGLVQQPLRQETLFCFGWGRAVMLWRLTPRVDRLWSIAEVVGGRMPATPRPISAPLNPMTKR